MPGIADADANSIGGAEVKNTAYTGPVSLYLSLHTADPGKTGASEVTGGSYARQAVTFGTFATGQASNTAKIDFTSMPAATVTHIGIWDASTAGTFHQSGALTASVTVTAGNTLEFAIGAVNYSVNAV